MTPEYPPNPRAELEAKVTALLLGELSADEAANMRELIAQDPELARLHDRLTATLGLLRESAAQPAPLKLSPERREKLLALFKTIEPKEFDEPRRRMISLLEVAAVVAIVGILAALFLPALANSKAQSKRVMIMSNLRLLDAAKQQWAIEQHQSLDARPTMDDLTPYFGHGGGERGPGSVAGETYILGKVGEMPVARFESGRNKDKTITLPGVEENQVAVNESASTPTPAMPAQPAPSPILGVPAASTSQIILPQTDQQHAGEDTSLAKNDGFNRWTVNGAIQTQEKALSSPQGADQLKQSDQVSLQALNDNNGSGAAGIPPPVIMVAPAASSYNATNAVVDYDRITPSAELKDKVVTLGLTGASQSSGPAESAMNGVINVDRHRLEAAPHAGMAMTENNKQPEASFSWKLKEEPPSARMQLNSDGSVEPDTGVGALASTAVVAKSITNSGTVELYFDTSRQTLSNVPLPVTPQAASGTVPPVSSPAPAAGFGGGAIFGPKDLADAPLPHPLLPAPAPQPEVLTSVNAFTTFSLNVSDVAFKLAQASLQNGVMPDAASMRSEEFINAFDYRDPEPASGAPIGFAWERAGDPFAQNRDFLRFSIKAAAQGREAGRPLNLVLLLDKSGSMERADRVEIIARALKVLASQLQPNDTLSVVVFARTAHLFVDGVSGQEAAEIAKKLRDLTPEGGTNLEEAMKLAYATALRHYLANGENRVVLMTDGAANLGNVDPNVLKKNVEGNRKQGIALDCFGVGWDGYNDNLLETLSRAGNGRYGFLNTPEEAATEFAGKLAGALRVAAADVKVQVEFNPKRVMLYRQIGYAKDKLKKEDFRDNNVKAAQIGAAESGNALYTVEINPAGEGDLCTVHVRFRVPGTQDYQEHEWTVPYTGSAIPLDQASPAMRLCASAASFCEWLAGSPYAVDVTPEKLLGYLNGVPQVYGADQRPAKLQMMILQARRISGK